MESLSQVNEVMSSGLPLILFESNYSTHTNIHDAFKKGMGNDWKYGDILCPSVIDHIASNIKINQIKQTYNLTDDECGAIAYYKSDVTRLGGSLDDCPYRRINTLFTTRKISLMEIWKSFLFHLLSGLYKLPNIKKKVYRALDLPINSLSSQYTKGNQVCWIGFTSASIDKEKMKSFIDDKNKSGTFMLIDVIEGKDISCFSFFPDEAELLLLPNSLFNVDEIISDKDLFGIPSSMDGIILTQKPTPVYLQLKQIQSSPIKNPEPKFIVDPILKNKLLDACGKLPLKPNLETLHILLQNNAHIKGHINEFLDERGSSLIMYVIGPANEDSLPIVKLLEDYGGSASHFNYEGQDALWYAQYWQKYKSNPYYPEIIKYLKKKGCVGLTSFK